MGGGIDPGYWRPGHGHIARVLRLAHFHERVQVNVVLGEPVKVLEEQLQLLAGERLVMSVVSHTSTLRPSLMLVAASSRTRSEHA